MEIRDFQKEKENWKIFKLKINRTSGFSSPGGGRQS